MFSRFVNLFKKSDLDEQRAFQSKVLSIVRELQPGMDYRISEDPLSLLLDEQTFGLTNVRANYLLSNQTDDILKEIVSEYFQNVLVGVEIADRKDMEWDTAKPLLMPQLMPVDFLKKFPLISRPFGSDIVIGYVIDSEAVYSYVTSEDIEQWGVSEDKVNGTALDNLSARTKGIEITQVQGSNGILAINTMDGFDAARIVSPEFQDYCGELIGSPFYFGVPNRDFLICWSKNDDTEFQNSMKHQNSKDFEERPYPLSPSVFESLGEGRLRQLIADTADPRAAAADTN